VVAEQAGGGELARIPRRATTKKALIHAFVAFHLFAVLAWSFTPEQGPGPLSKALCRRVEHYMLPTGLWQSWMMFAPNPAMYNVYLQAEVTFRDETHATWQFPRLETFGYFERYRKERYRRWASGRVWIQGLNGGANRAVGEAAAQYAARQVSQDPANPPARVELYYYYARIPPPSREQLARRVPSPPVWERKSVFACEFDEAGVPHSKGVNPDTRPAGTLPAQSQPGAAQGAAAPEGAGQ
jgi:hypothetical protein